MEKITNIENFESFLGRVRSVFEAEGLSDNLKTIINNWYQRRYEENGQPGGTLEQRVLFEMELAQIYVETERFELARETFQDAQIEAHQEGLVTLVEKISDLLELIKD